MLERAEIVDKEVSSKVLVACQPIMQTLAPVVKETPLTISLHNHIYPGVFNLQVVTLNGTLQGVQNDTLTERDFHPPALNTEVFNVGVPFYKTSAIQYLADLYNSIFKVSVGGQTLCAKVNCLTTYDSIYSELKTIDEVRRANFDSATRVPQLRGIITSHTDIVGLLMDYILSRAHHLAYLLDSAKRSSPEARRQTSNGTGGKDDNSDDEPVYTITTQQKQKWARQIEHNLKSLHSRGIIWGDAKPSNVLIDDMTDDA